MYEHKEQVQPFPEDLKKSYFDVKKLTIKPNEWFKATQEKPKDDEVW